MVNLAVWILINIVAKLLTNILALFSCTAVYIRKKKKDDNKKQTRGSITWLSLLFFFFNCVHILLGGSLADWSQQRPGSLVFSTRAKAAGYGRWFLIDHGAGSNKKKVEKTYFEARYYGLQTDSSPVLSKALISSNEKTFHRPLRTRCRIRLPRPFSAWVTRMIERFFGSEFFDSGIFSRKSWQVLFLVGWFN